MTDVIRQLLYPKGSSYGTIDLSDIAVVEQNAGIAPLHYNTQRSVYQHGETPINLRLDPRVIQLAIARDFGSRSQFYDNLIRLMRRLDPGRNWSASGSLTKCIYRKIVPGGRKQWRSDLITVSGSNQVTSATAMFAEWGLSAGSPFTILTGSDAGEYVVDTLLNENNLKLTQSMAFSATGIEYRIVTGRIARDLDVLLEAGPVLEDDRQDDSMAINDTIRLVAHNPVWYNPQLQTITWGVDELENLIFYDPVNRPNRLEFPIWFGSDYISSNESLVYVGTWPSRPMIIVTGPFQNMSLENLSTNDALRMEYVADVGETVVVDLEALTVINNYGHNLMRYMSTPYTDLDSDLITFGLYPDPHVIGGLNHMHVGLSGALIGHTSASMLWHARYTGA